MFYIFGIGEERKEGQVSRHLKKQLEIVGALVAVVPEAGIEPA